MNKLERKGLKNLAYATMLKYVALLIYIVGFGCLITEHYILFIILSGLAFIFIIGNIIFECAFFIRILK